MVQKPYKASSQASAMEQLRARWLPQITSDLYPPDVYRDLVHICL